jgi:hypothetical protein
VLPNFDLARVDRRAIERQIVLEVLVCATDPVERAEAFLYLRRLDRRE